MARTLTKKQRTFVNRKADGATGVAAVLNNYDTDNYETANAIAVENLQKPLIIASLKEMGFDSNNAKRVVAEILNDEEAEAKDRLKAAEQVFKVNSDYAPEKSVNVNVQVDAKSEEIQELANKAALLLKEKKT